MTTTALTLNSSVRPIFERLDVRNATRDDYQRRVQHFLAFSRTIPFDRDVLLRYKQSLRNDMVFSVATKNKYLSCARILLREAYRLGIIPFDPTLNVKSLQQSKKHKVFGLDDQDVSLVCGWINQNPTKLREQAILCLLLFQGLRQAEICNIRFEDIRPADRTLLILGKGRDDKEPVRLHPQTLKALRRYTVQSGAGGGYIFTSERRASADGKLSVRGLRHIVKRIFAELGIDRTVHGFRHTYTTRLIQHMPGDLFRVAQFTRHRSIETLQIYNDSVVGEQDYKHVTHAFADIAQQLALQRP